MPSKIQPELFVGHSLKKMRERITQADNDQTACNIPIEPALTACTVRRIWSFLRPFWNALASISGLPSALTTVNPALSSRTLWNPVQPHQGFFSPLLEVCWWKITLNEHAISNQSVHPISRRNHRYIHLRICWCHVRQWDQHRSLDRRKILNTWKIGPEEKNLAVNAGTYSTQTNPCDMTTLTLK